MFELCEEITEKKLCPNVVLIQSYDENGSIAKHSDNEKEMVRNEKTGLVKPIVSISFGATCEKFRVKKKEMKEEGKRKRVTSECIELLHGDVLIMKEGTQEMYEHYILKDSIKGKRISMTFREQN